jgi:hypothetical protein
VLIIYSLSFIYTIYLVTLTLYEKIDEDMVILSITICSDVYCSLSLAGEIKHGTVGVNVMLGGHRSGIVIQTLVPLDFLLGHQGVRVVTGRRGCELDLCE